MLAEVPFEKLNHTFQQAITLARELGFSYLWIDSLCIIQDSDEDWQKESSEIGSAYFNALFNIAAAAASDGSEGPQANKNCESAASVVAGIPSRGNEHICSCLKILRGC
jgi:hypothetical protein